MSLLMRELVLCRRRALQEDAAEGMRSAGIATGRLVGIDFITCNGRTYRPEKGGKPAFILPSFALAVDRCVLDDLVAIDVESGQITTRYGVAIMLGGEWLDAAVAWKQRVPVYMDGLHWLCNGCNGVLVIDPELARFALADAPGISCGSNCIAKRLYDAMAKPVRVPPFFVLEGRLART